LIDIDIDIDNCLTLVFFSVKYVNIIVSNHILRVVSSLSLSGTC